MKRTIHRKLSLQRMTVRALDMRRATGGQPTDPFPGSDPCSQVIQGCGETHAAPCPAPSVSCVHCGSGGSAGCPASMLNCIP
jgi:hypothetical protein